MKTVGTLFLVAVCLYLTPAAFGQRVLDTTEAQGILKELTSQPRSTWISVGTIEGTHYQEGGPRTTDSTLVAAKIKEAETDAEAEAEAAAKTRDPSTVDPNPQALAVQAARFNAEYKLTNRYTMTTDETVMYDGRRFHWDVVVADRYDSMALPSEFVDGDERNFMVDHYEMHKDWNQHRIFAWDGSEYTTYSASGGHLASFTADKIDPGYRPVNGPLTAGLIPWGIGRFSADSLMQATVSATEIDLDGTACIEMEISYDDGAWAKLVLDLSKKYAVKTATLVDKIKSHNTPPLIVTYKCYDYQLCSGQYVPSQVEIKRQNIGTDSAAPTAETWTGIRVTSTTAPSPSSFKVAVGLDTTVEYISPATTSPLLYINSYEVDTDKLLLERLDYVAAGSTRPQNCATISLQHVASEFGKSLSSAAMTNLVGADGGTSLYDLKRAAQNLDLHARIVNTDLAALENLGNTKAILYLPDKRHFVILDRVDGPHVWLIDLSGNKFYYRENAYLFPITWSTGTAMLVSDQPLSSGLSELSDTAAKEIVGGYWICGNLYQEEAFIFCYYEPGIACDGWFQYYYERYVCKCVDIGTCNWGGMVRYQETPCIIDPIVECRVTGTWTFHYMRACTM